MDASYSGQVHGQPFPSFDKPARGETIFFQAVADSLGAVVQAFSPLLHDPIDFGRNLADQDLSLALVAQIEGRLQRDSLEAG